VCTQWHSWRIVTACARSYRKPELEEVVRVCGWTIGGAGPLIRLARWAILSRSRSILAGSGSGFRADCRVPKTMSDVTGQICTMWNERESTWRKSGSCPSRSTNSAECVEPAQRAEVLSRQAKSGEPCRRRHTDEKGKSYNGHGENKTSGYCLQRTLCGESLVNRGPSAGKPGTAFLTWQFTNLPQFGLEPRQGTGRCRCS
jgi:hypothetical protein